MECGSDEMFSRDTVEKNANYGIAPRHSGDFEMQLLASDASLSAVFTPSGLRRE